MAKAGVGLDSVDDNLAPPFDAIHEEAFGLLQWAGSSRPLASHTGWGSWQNKQFRLGRVAGVRVKATDVTV